jgi:hypothetical protein
MNIDIIKLLPIIIIIISFSFIIYFIVRSFRSTCPDGTEFNDKLNKCVPICKDPLILNSDGTNCICPDNKVLKDDKCVKNCTGDTPLLCGDDNCYSSATSTCINGKLCPNSLSCGNYCCELNQKCSNNKIIFLNDDSFILKEKDNDIIISVPKNLKGYSFDINDTNYLPEILQNLLNMNTKNKYKYNITFKESNDNGIVNKILQFNVSNNSTFQPAFDFSKMINPEKLGFKNDKYQFNNNSLESSNIETYVCEVRPCDDDEIICDNTCCPKDSCIEVQGKSICCNEKDGFIICGSGNTVSCCPKGIVCCNGICCSEGEDCINGKCMIKCKYNDKNGNILHCDPDYEQTGEHCVDLDNKKISYCGHKDCTFNAVAYYPTAIEGPNHMDKNAIDVCVSNLNGNCSFNPSSFNINVKDINNINFLKNDNYQNSNCKYYTIYNDKLKLERTEIAPFASEYSKNCTADDCEGRINEYGVIDVTTDESKLCLANFDCKKVLEKNGTNCPFGENHPQCCYNNNNYTGQVCDKNQIAYYNRQTNDCDCIQGWTPIELPNKRGTRCEIVSVNSPRPKILSNIDCGVTCYTGNTGPDCENYVSVQNYTNSDVIIILNKIANEMGYKNISQIFTNLPWNPAEYVIMLPLINVLKTKEQPVNRNYYGPFISIVARNYYDQGSLAQLFRDKLYNDYGGDLITNSGNNNIQFNYKNGIEPNSGAAYVNINLFGYLIEGSWFYPNTKYFQSIYNNSSSYKGDGVNVILLGPYDV